VEGLVQLPAAEGRAMGAFMPMGIARGVERAVDEKGGDRPPAAPGEEGDDPAPRQQDDPGGEIAQARGIAALDELLQGIAWKTAAEPLPLDPAFDGAVVEGERVLRAAGELVSLLPVPDRHRDASALADGCNVKVTARECQSTGSGPPGRGRQIGAARSGAVRSS